MEQAINKNELQNPLMIFCFDSVTVCDKTTFLSYTLGKIRMSYWYEEVKEEKSIIDGMFAILFNKVIERRQNAVTKQNDQIK